MIILESFRHSTNFHFAGYIEFCITSTHVAIASFCLG